MRLVKLTFTFPSEGLELITEILTSMSPAVDHFTTWLVEGNLEIGQNAKISEQVRGRLDQRILLTILPEERIPHILDAIRQDFKGVEISYWVEPIEAYGMLSANNL